MQTFVRNPPEDKILPKKYWKRHDNYGDYKINPIGYLLCPECGFYFPIFNRGKTPELCYRCRRKNREKKLKAVRLTEENYHWVSEHISNFSNFVNGLIKEHREKLNR